LVIILVQQNKSPFKWRHFEPAVILLCVRWYCRCQLSAQTSHQHRQPISPPRGATAIARSVLPSVVLITLEGGCYGSGFFVTTELVATNEHVLECGGRGTVRLTNNAQVFPVLASWTDQPHDLALVKVAGAGAHPLLLAQDWPAVGDDIYVAGNPEGLEGTFSRGIVSSLRKGEGLIQFDASISPGSSGGPVVDTQGRVVGVTVASVRQGQNLNFAVPFQFLPALITRARSGAASDTPAITRNMPPPAPANPVRRQWEAKPDWTLFALDILGDDTVPERLKALVDSGISPDEKDIQGRTAWHVAAERGQTGLARYLREHKANPDPRDPLGRTPLMLVPLVGAPVFHSLNPWAWVWTASLCSMTPPSDNDHDPTLFLLAWFQRVQAHRAVMRELIEAHADVNARDDAGSPVLDYATQPLVDFDRLLYATGRVRGAQACELPPAQAPPLQGFRLGMSLNAALANQTLVRLRAADTPERDACGRRTLEYNAPPTTPLREYLGGPPESIDISHVTLAFIDERLVYLRVVFGRGTKWQEQYTQTLAQALGRPADWHDLGIGPDLSTGRLLSCAGWQAVAGFNAVGPYVELHDLSALQLLPPRLSEQLRRARPGNAR
jgi:hypothetical protein